MYIEPVRHNVYSAKKLNTFEDVQMHYLSIKPIVSMYHTLQDDVRPIHQRHKKTDRISAGRKEQIGLGWFMDLINLSCGWACNSNDQWDKPDITWEKKDTYDKITIRHNGYQTSMAFLDAWLPDDLRFGPESSKRNGSHFIATYDPKRAYDFFGRKIKHLEKFPIPSCKSSALSCAAKVSAGIQGVMSFVRERTDEERRLNSPPTTPWKLAKDSNLYRKPSLHTSYEAISKEAVNKFMEWAMYTSPLLIDQIISKRRETTKKLHYLVDEYLDIHSLPYSDVRDAVREELHEGRVNILSDLMTLMAFSSQDFERLFSNEKLFRSRLRHYLLSAMGCKTKTQWSIKEPKNDWRLLGPNTPIGLARIREIH